MKSYGLGSFNAFLLAVLVYMGLVFFLFYKISSKAEAQIYTDIKDSFIDVDLGSFTPNMPKNIQTNEEQSGANSDDSVQETTNKAVVTRDENIKESSINSLFGELKDFQEAQSTKVQSSAKSTPNAAKAPNAEDLFKQLNDNLLPTEQQSGESTKAQRTGIYDAFLGAIKRKLDENWGLYERSGNFAVEVQFFIDGNGKFGYTFVSKSLNPEFDAKVLEFLKNLEGKFIAYPPKNQRYEGVARLSDEILMEATK